MILLKDHTQVGMAWQVVFTLDLFFVFSPNKLKMELVNGPREIIPSPYPMTIMLKFLSFCIYNIINKHNCDRFEPSSHFMLS